MPPLPPQFFDLSPLYYAGRWYPNRDLELSHILLDCYAGLLITTLLKPNLVFFLISTSYPTLWTPSECPTFEIGPDTNFLELVQAFTGRNSVPQNCFHFKCQSQVQVTVTSDWSIINSWEIPKTESPPRVQ